MKKWIIALIAESLVLVLIGIFAFYQTQEIQTWKGQTKYYQATVDRQKAEILTQLNTVSSQEEKIKKLEKQIQDLNKKTENTLGILGAKGNYLQLINKEGAHNPTWAELKSFLSADRTEDELYVMGTWVCGDYAETLHNNAERNGIAAGFVAISFEDSSTGHALNVFITTDKGVVFIDCTGSGSRLINLSVEHDTVGFIKVGKEYARVEMKKIPDNIDDFDYDRYEKYKSVWAKPSNMWEFTPGGIVKNIDIYW